MVAELAVMVSGEIFMNFLAKFIPWLIKQLEAAYHDVSQSFHGMTKQEWQECIKSFVKEQVGADIGNILNTQSSLKSRASATLNLLKTGTRQGMQQQNELLSIIKAISVLPVEKQKLYSECLKNITLLSIKVKLAEQRGEKIQANIFKQELQEYIDQTISMAKASRESMYVNLLLALGSFGGLLVGVSRALHQNKPSFSAVSIGLSGVLGAGFFGGRYAKAKREANDDSQVLSALESYQINRLK